MPCAPVFARGEKRLSHANAPNGDLSGFCCSAYVGSNSQKSLIRRDSDKPFPVSSSLFPISAKSLWKFYTGFFCPENTPRGNFGSKMDRAHREMLAPYTAHAADGTMRDDHSAPCIYNRVVHRIAHKLTALCLHSLHSARAGYTVPAKRMCRAGAPYDSGNCRSERYCLCIELLIRRIASRKKQRKGVVWRIGCPAVILIRQLS